MRVINLLPKDRQLELRYQNILAAVFKAVIFSLLGFALVFLIQFGAKLYLASQKIKTEAEIVQLTVQVNQQDNAKVKDQIDLANNTTSDYLTLSSAAPKWSKVLRAFSKLPPAEVRITSFTANSSTKMVNISGTSPDRETMIQLYNNIKNDEKEFYNVDYPLENVVKAQNVNFHFSFYAQDSLLK